jgi:CheY-like chemotaxis protein
MVYGFVKQSDGHIMIYSEPGHGSTVRIYLPRVRDAEDVDVEIAEGPVIGGNETVLVVEDDEEVRATVVDLLVDLGYRVLKARDAQNALAIVDSGMAIDLLFTDVVMPGPVRSPELARLARIRLPEIAVLFTSGYTDNAIVHGGRLDHGTELLSKPYTREALARKIRHVLRNQQQRKPVGSRERPFAAPLNQGRSLNILFVEDDELIRMSTIDMLTGLGHEVYEAGEAVAALDLLGRHAIDVLMTDLGLPGMSGGRLAAEACRLQPGLRVIFATGGDASPAGDGGPAADGAAAMNSAVMLQKPYDIRALNAALRAAGERRR